MTPDWIIVNRTSGALLMDQRFPSEQTAKSNLQRLGEAFTRLYWPIPSFQNQYWKRTLTEGFKTGDLENILLPQFSVDIYVPSDPNTDNIVVGFLIKGVPEAVFPFKQFLSFCRGVKHVDYGDSDTLPHTSIVYVEFDRDHFHVDHLDDMVDQVCRLSGFEAKDFSVSFPNTQRTFPYSRSQIAEYFEERSRRKNHLSQEKANKERTDLLQKEIEHQMRDGTIAKMLGAPAAQSAAPSETDLSIKKLQGIGGVKNKLPKLKGPEITDATKTMIVTDAKRNLGQHSETWEQFDKRWAGRLHVTPSRVSSIRKRVYDL